MRRNRIIWFCLWVLSIVGISFKGGAVTYGFFTLLTLVPVFSALYLLAVYMFFHIYQDLEQRFVSVNEPVTYRFALVNEYPVQFAGIRVRFFSSFSSITDLTDADEYELKPHTRIEKETQLICKYRGEYEIGIKEIEITDFFRLFRIKYKNKECIRAFVKPQLLTIDHLGGTELSDAVKRSGASKTELDILSREYVPGDDIRFINWNQSARTGGLMTRIFSGSDQREITILTDTFRISSDPAEFLPSENRVLELTLAIAYYFIRNNISVAEYHLRQELVRLSAENTQRFEEFYEDISQIAFSSLNTHQLMYDQALRRRDIFESSMAFLIVSSWDSAADGLLKEFEANNIYAVVCFVGSDEKECPDLSGHNKCELIYCDIAKELTE
jgi:uncharacterized protein (DUF58 family)